MEGSNFDSLETGFGERVAVEFANLRFIMYHGKKGVERETERVRGFFLSEGIKNVLHKL